MSTHTRMVFCTCPDTTTASALAKGVVQHHLAACVNLVPGLISVYAWQGQIETSDETLMIIKTRSDRLKALENFIVTHHPYELPEVIAVPIDQGNQDYLEWISTWLDSSR